MIKVGLKPAEICGILLLVSFAGCGHYHGCSEKQMFLESIGYEILKPILYLKSNNKKKSIVKLVELID